MSEEQEDLKTLRIYGASDDLVEIEGAVDAEINTGEPCAIQIGDRSGLCTLVVMAYGDMGEAVWTAKVAPLDEDIPMHEVRLGLHSSGYSVLVEIDVPQGTRIRWGSPGFWSASRESQAYLVGNGGVDLT